jgi:N-methylhydantoinase B
LEKHPLNTVDPDHLLITNDPYAGAQHLPDIFVFQPVFHGGEIIAFSGTVGHHIDVGGGTPGSGDPSVTDIYQEGLLIPSLKLRLGRDLYGGLFEQLFAANIRSPHETIGDLYAQLAANRTGEKRLNDIVDKYGLQTVRAGMERLLHYAEERTRNAISKVPNGVYTGRDYLDGDAFYDEPIPILATITVQDTDIIVDFEGTAPQVKSFINAPFSATVSAAQTAVKSVLTDQTVPPNSGCFRPVTVRAPFGCLLNPKPPAPVRARINTACRAFTAVMRALSQVLPENVCSSGFEATSAIRLSLLENGVYSIFGEPLRAGYGATCRTDGADVLSTSLSNCANTPIEAAETSHGFFFVQRYELVRDSGGAGEHRGGLGARREYRVFAEEVTFTCFSDRHSLRPWGLFGGQDGTTGKITVFRGDREIVLRPLDRFTLQRGDQLRVETGGGAGYGAPKRRKGPDLMRDVQEERVSRDAAVAAYGFSAAAEESSDQSPGGVSDSGG